MHIHKHTYKRDVINKGYGCSESIVGVRMDWRKFTGDNKGLSPRVKRRVYGVLCLNYNAAY